MALPQKTGRPTMHPWERYANRKIGPGGYLCNCCGPTPKDRPKHRRLVRKRIKEDVQKHVRKYHESLSEAPNY
jgi:hypothetical protein